MVDGKYVLSLVNEREEAFISSCLFDELNQGYFSYLKHWYKFASKKNGPDIVGNAPPTNLETTLPMDISNSRPLSEKDFAKVMATLRGE